MEKTGSHNIVLSLGSNQGNRRHILQEAVFMLQEELGRLVKVSALYESPSWGFDGPSFLNACMLMETELQPSDVLSAILKTEQRLGRVRKAGMGYQSRTIDIDLLYFDYETIDIPGLQVPHPKLHERKFILRPLADVAPQWYHPVLNKDTRNLLQECAGEEAPVKLDQPLYSSREMLLARLEFLAVEGNIGAGKTTLAGLISDDYNGKLVLERFADNPFLPKFYKDPSRYSFPLEMSFLADRYQQFIDDTSQFDLFKTFMVSDYDIYKSLIFARITLAPEEFELYRKIFQVMYKEVRKPGLYLYLYQHPDRLLEQIRKRGRDYEQEIQADYLEKINRGYMEFIRSYPGNSLILDVSELDFVENEADYKFILGEIQKKILEVY